MQVSAAWTVSVYNIGPHVDLDHWYTTARQVDWSTWARYRGRRLISFLAWLLGSRELMDHELRCEAHRRLWGHQCHIWGSLLWCWCDPAPKLPPFALDEKTEALLDPEERRNAAS